MKTKTYLKNAKLSGYKSIKKLSIDFEPSLNIIIGKNSAGKSNFLEFIDRCLWLEYTGLYNFSSELEFQNDDTYTIKAELKTITKIENNLVLPTNTEIKQTFYKNDKDQLDLTFFLINQFFYGSNFVKHGIPTTYNLIDKPYSFNFALKEFPFLLQSQLLDSQTPHSIKKFIHSFFQLSMYQYDEKLPIIPQIKTKILIAFETLENIKNHLQKITSIQDIRLNENFNIYYEENKKQFTINNIFLEFKIFNDWLPFSCLSDGTKRIVYIVMEVLSNITIHKKIGLQNRDDSINRIILIEEPELGIHPHQLHQLMIFLKEQSHDKQIIMTTHAPKAIDILDDSELNKIILAFNTSENGTQLRHLSEKEIVKGKKYMQEDFLSDYWIYSDLEK